MFVGDINNGLLYRFILNEARNDVSFDSGYVENTAPLVDREVNTPIKSTYSIWSRFWRYNRYRNWSRWIFVCVKLYWSFI